jgi:hypothetical protein
LADEEEGEEKPPLLEGPAMDEVLPKADRFEVLFGAAGSEDVMKFSPLEEGLLAAARGAAAALRAPIVSAGGKEERVELCAPGPGLARSGSETVSGGPWCVRVSGTTIAMAAPAPSRKTDRSLSGEDGFMASLYKKENWRRPKPTPVLVRFVLAEVVRY